MNNKGKKKRRRSVFSCRFWLQGSSHPVEFTPLGEGPQNNASRLRLGFLPITSVNSRTVHNHFVRQSKPWQAHQKCTVREHPDLIILDSALLVDPSGVEPESCPPLRCFFLLSQFLQCYRYLYSKSNKRSTTPFDTLVLCPIQIEILTILFNNLQRTDFRWIR